jgi:hypothetical protein
MTSLRKGDNLVSKRVTAKLAYRALRHYYIPDETEKENRYGCIIR